MFENLRAQDGGQIGCLAQICQVRGDKLALNAVVQKRFDAVELLEEVQRALGLFCGRHSFASS